LFSLIKKNNPNAKEPNIQTWAKHIDLMLRLDGRSLEQIEDIIKFSQTDSFWQVNILSTAKVREKFDQLWMKRNKPIGKSKDKSFGEREYTEADIEDLYFNPTKEADNV
jgi:hypothetical protein